MQKRTPWIACLLTFPAPHRKCRQQNSVYQKPSSLGWKILSLPVDLSRCQEALGGLVSKRGDFHNDQVGWQNYSLARWRHPRFDWTTRAHARLLRTRFSLFDYLLVRYLCAVQKSLSTNKFRRYTLTPIRWSAIDQTIDRSDVLWASLSGRENQLQSN